MSFYCPPKYETNYPNRNEEFLNLSGELEDKEAQITLAQFLRYNLGFGMEVISGIRPALYQEILLKTFFNRNFSMFTGARGSAKSTVAGWLSFLITIFEPNTNVLLSGPSFRCARNIFNSLEKIVTSKDATLLRHCFTENPSRRNDEFFWKINGGTIRAVPLTEKLRGFRANVLILDEFLLLSEDIVKNVLQPFLIAPSNIARRMEITEREDKLILSGNMKEIDRTVFESTARLIVLTSASYTFENAFKVYTEWTDKIYDKNPVESAKYFVCNLSYEALPEYMVEKSVIEEAKGSAELHPAFLREYCARYVDGSESFFSAKKMHELTVKDGESPSIKLFGDKEKEYILSCDPCFSNSPTSDYFAFCILELNKEEEKATVVHTYMEAGKDLKDHIKYFYYLLRAFNVVMICIDNADGQFIASANESALFKDNNLKVNIIDYDGDLQGDEYNMMLNDIKKKYNLNNKDICFKHVFNQPSIRRINEQLQTWINTSKIYFGSRLTQNESYDSIINGGIPYPYEPKEDQGRFIVNLVSTEDDLMYQLKKQCSLIEVKSSPTGGQVFDLPSSLKRNTSANRARKDGYTSLLLAVEGAKAYFDMNKSTIITKSKILWTPTMFGSSTYS